MPHISIKFSKKEKDKIIKMKMDGMFCKEIGVMFGCSDGPILKVLHGSGRKDVLRNFCTITKEEEKKIVRLRKNGVSLDELEKIFGYSATSICRFFTSRGISFRRTLSKREIIKTVKLRKMGLSCKKISKTIGCGYSTIRRVLIKQGVVIKEELKEKEVKKIVKMYKNGDSPVTISEKIRCCSAYTVAIVLKNNGYYIRNLTEARKLRCDRRRVQNERE